VLRVQGVWGVGSKWCREFGVKSFLGAGTFGCRHFGAQELLGARNLRGMNFGGRKSTWLNPRSFFIFVNRSCCYFFDLHTLFLDVT